MSCCDSEDHVCSRWIYDHIWSCLGPVTTPSYVTRPQTLMLYNQEVWKPRGTFLVITCCSNRCPNTSPEFLCVTEVSHEPSLFNSALLHLSPQRSTSVNLLKPTGHVMHQQLTLKTPN